MWLKGEVTKVASRAEAVRRYGPIDFASRHWPQRSKWIKMFDVPTGWFPGWNVLDTHQPVRHIACNIDLHKPLLRALTNVKDGGTVMAHQLRTFDGCFNIRMVRGSNTHFSAHSYGLALDINARENPLGSTRGGFFETPYIVRCFTDAGFTWGGDFHNRKDAMHWSYSWE